jgi:hypothetical protein
MHWVEGQTEIAVFAGVDGNWYRMEADYDHRSRLTEFRSFFNGEFVGRENPSWSGTEQTGHLATSSEGYWVSANADGELSAMGSSPGDAEYRSDCDQVQDWGPCSNQFWNYGFQSLGLVSGVALVGGAAIATGSGSGFVLAGSAGMLAYQTRNWYLSMRELDSCIKQYRGNPVDHLPN